MQAKEFGPKTSILFLKVCLFLEQGYSYLPAGVRISSTGRTTTYDRGLAWKVLDDDDSIQCIAFLFMNWSFVTWQMFKIQRVSCFRGFGDFIDERSLPSFLLGSSKKAANFETRLCARTCSHTLKPPMSWRWIQSLGLDQFWYYEAMSYLSGWSFSLSNSCPATSYAFHARTLISKRTPTLWPVYYKLLRVFLSSDHEVELLNCILFESAA